MFTDLQAAYIAGLFDGEGYANMVTSNGSSYSQPSIVIGNTVRKPLDWLAERIECSRVDDRGHSNPQPQWKPFFAWRMSCKRHSYQFLRAIRPYLQIKESRADEMLAALATQYPELAS